MSFFRCGTPIPLITALMARAGCWYTVVSGNLRLKGITMRISNSSHLAAAIFVFLAPVLRSQGDASRSIQGGGITVAGWAGKIDASEERAGQALQNAKFAQEGNL